jgi:hypothetical protein
MGKNSKGKKIYKDSELETLRNDEVLRLDGMINKIGKVMADNPTCLDSFKDSRLAICTDTSARIGRYDAMLLYNSSLTDDEIKDLKEPAYKKIYDFQSKLNEGHIRELLLVMNDLVFVETQTVASVRQWLACEHKEPVRVRKNYLLAFLMDSLAEKGFICRNWQKVAEEMKVFTNKKILTQKNLSKCLHNAVTKYGTNNIIYNTVKGLKR